jgi:hypothetical protein
MVSLFSISDTTNSMYSMKPQRSYRPLTNAQVPATNSASIPPLNTDHQSSGTRHYQYPPFCCESIITWVKSNGDAAEHSQIDHFVDVMKHDPHGFFSHDSNWNPTICVTEIFQMLLPGSLPYRNLISIETRLAPRDDSLESNASSSSQPYPKPREKFFVSTWGTAHCNNGSYLEVDVKNGTWSSAEVIRQAIVPYYNNERQIYQQFRCASHPEVEHRVWVWHISKGAADLCKYHIGITL